MDENGSSPRADSPGSEETAIRADRLVYRISHSWMVWFSLIFGAYVALPFLAPVFMAAGWEGPGRAIYTVYSFLCHQLPQRSYFLFGEHISYPLFTASSRSTGRPASLPGPFCHTRGISGCWRSSSPGFRAGATP